MEKGPSYSRQHGGELSGLWSVLCALIPAENTPYSSWVSLIATWTSSPAEAFASIQLWVRHSTRKLHSSSTCPEPKSCLSTSHMSQGQFLPWSAVSWGDERFSPSMPPETAGDCGSNDTASVCMPIKMRDWGTCLGQGSPSLSALASVEFPKGLLNLYLPSLTVLPAEKLNILHPAARSLSFFSPVVE